MKNKVIIIVCLVALVLSSIACNDSGNVNTGDMTTGEKIRWFMTGTNPVHANAPSVDCPKIAEHIGQCNP